MLEEETNKRIVALESENIRLKKQLLESKLQIQELIEHEKLLSTVANSVDSVIFLLKVESLDAFRFIFINDQFFNDTGFKQEQFVGKLVHEVVPPESYKKEHQRYLEAIEKRDTIFWEEESPYEEGIRTGLVAMRPLFEGDRCTHVIGIISDITLRINAERELKTNTAKLEQLNNTKDKMLSIISHDLKSPFSAILGFSNLMFDKLEERDFEKVKEYAKVINQASYKNLELLNNLLDWTRTQTGKIDFAPQQILLQELVDEIFSLFEYGAEQKGISIKYDIPVGQKVYADMNMLHTILRNLVSNAIKFTSAGGTVTINASQTKDGVQVCVSDTGVGIPEPKISRLFQMQQKNSTDGTDNEKGTGLGLLICKEFMDAHGGKISVESKLGAGTRFILNLNVPTI